MRRRTALALWALLLLAPTLLVSGCQDGVVGDVTPNSPPETRVTARPPALEQTSFTVQFFWTGSDVDGWIDRFEWRISDNGPDGVVDVEDTLGLDWNSTVVTDSTFVVSADLDSFLNDVENPQIQNPKDYRFWQTHTFFVRAVDNLGVSDPEPAQVSFTATTLSPTVTIDRPTFTGAQLCVGSARALTFGWEGNDPDDVVGDPAEVRYALVNVTEVDFPDRDPLPSGACITQTEYRQLNPVAHFDEAFWSEWIPYDAPEDSGRVVTFPLKDLGQSFFFAVQVKDVAGAVTPTFEWGRNLRHVKITPNKLPQLAVTERFLGTETGVGPSKIAKFEIVAGQPLEFTWIGNADSYAGIIDAYRYGWEIQDVNDEEDPGWAVPWGSGPSFRRAPTRSFQQGNPNFVVQCRDNSGSITRVTYQFEVVQITPRANQLDLLVIDDFGLGTTPQEQEIKSRWRAQWNSMLEGRVVNYDPVTDFFDAGENAFELTFRLINQYKAVIWFLNGANDNTVFAQKLRPQLAQVRYNWLEVYQAKVGNLLFTGPNASVAMVEPVELLYPLVYNTDERPPNGLGVRRLPDGTEIRKGTERWPYKGWCIETTDYVRPATAAVCGEQEGGIRTRELRCAYLTTAVLADTFVATYPSAGDGVVGDLVMSANSPRLPDPTKNGVPQDRTYRQDWEEFYNRDVTTAAECTRLFNERSCMVPMFLHRAARDDVYPEGHARAGQPLVALADSLCQPFNRDRSPLDRAPIGVVSSVYSSQKQLPNSNDFLWGFHPLGFRTDRVQAALLWIIGENWQIRTN